MKHVFVCLTLLLSLVACSEKPAEPEPRLARSSDSIRLKPDSPWIQFVHIEPVKDVDESTLVTLPGRVTFNEDLTQRVASPVDGRVHAILVHPGDKVKAGQPLLELTSPALAQLQADAEKAAQDLSVAQTALDRANKLRVDGAISDKEYGHLEADYKKAQAEITRTTAQLDALGIKPDHPVSRVALYARLPGTVVQRDVLVGQEVRADAPQPLVTLTNLESLWVVADIYEQDVGLINRSKDVTVRVPAYPGETFAGTITYVGDVVDATTRTVKVRCSVANTDLHLKPEMFAKVDIQAPPGTKMIRVPSRAVLSNGEKSEVVVAEQGSVFHLRPVEVGPEIDGYVRVLKGLEPKEVIVSEGALFLRHEIQEQ